MDCFAGARNDGMALLPKFLAAILTRGGLPWPKACRTM